MNRSRNLKPPPISDLHIEATYRLTEALVDSEHRMRRRLDLLSEVVFETDGSGGLVYINKAWTDVLGYPEADCLGKTLATFVIDEDQGFLKEIIESGKAREETPIHLRRLDQKIVWMEISVSPIIGGGLVGTLRDLTAVKQVEDELAKLSLVASFTDNLVLITNRYGFVEWVNNAFVKRTGYTLADMLGRKPGAVLQGPGTDPETVSRVSQWVREGRSFQVELLNYTRAGESYWVSMQVTPVYGRDGKIRHFVAVGTDRSELRWAELELMAAKEKAESANDQKTQFMAIISHEMRTPLSVIVGSTELALAPEVELEEIECHLRSIDTHAEVLLRFINELLDISKIDAGLFAIKRTTVWLRECLEGVIMALGKHARAKRLAYHVVFDKSLPAVVMTDPDRLRQIVINLVENAVKFTDCGGVQVKVSCLNPSSGGGSALDIRVTDTGPGIAMEEQSRIFQRFERLDNSTRRRKDGAGLGLNIVKALVEALGGCISVRSKVGQGAIFKVVLPLEVVPEAACIQPLKVRSPVSVSRGGVGGALRRVLVAEDINASFAIIEIFLLKAGYLVMRATNGLEAVTKANEADLILMDIEMPGMDGLEAVQLIREAELQNASPPVPILALTAHAVKGYRERCLNAGFTGYLTKPIRRVDLLKALDEIFLGDQGGKHRPQS